MKDNNKVNHTLKEVVFNTVAKARQAGLKAKENKLKQCVECGNLIKPNLGQCNYCFVKFVGYPKEIKPRRFYECLGCFAKMDGFSKEMNKLTCSTICGLWLQRQILEAETQEDADKLCQKLGVEEHHLDEYFELEFNDPLGQFSSARLRDEYERKEKEKQ